MLHYLDKYGYTFTVLNMGVCLYRYQTHTSTPFLLRTSTTAFIIGSLDLFYKVSKNTPQLELDLKVSEIETVSWCYYLLHEELLKILNIM